MLFHPTIKEVYDDADPRGAPPSRLSGHILQDSSLPDFPLSYDVPSGSDSPRPSTSSIVENIPHPSDGLFPFRINPLPETNPALPQSYNHSLQHIGPASHFSMAAERVLATAIPRRQREYADFHSTLKTQHQPVNLVTGSSPRTSFVGGMIMNAVGGSNGPIGYIHNVHSPISNGTRTVLHLFNVHECQDIQESSADPVVTLTMGLAVK
ncbi:hypothetical protein B0H14DRAFT_3468528 [Mycena olivaceomarginata]|nr:hypothetical protein B0H14DRAFT_3468528 [Mycena olivaceomarginata]